MKTHKYLLACFVTLGLTLSSVFSAAIFEETFENKAADTYLGNVATSDGNATWASSASTWQVEEVTNTNALGLGNRWGFRYLNASNIRTTYITYNFDSLANYTVS